MRILHICSGYLGSKVHSELYRRLDTLGVKQTIYTYYQTGRPERNQFDGKRTQFCLRPLLHPWHRVFFYKKICLAYQDLRKQVQTDDVGMVHATTLFSDGVLAYKLWKEKSIPYVVTVRNTDINEFLEVAPWTWPMGMKVLKDAKKIIFISKAPMEKFCRHFLIKRILPKIKDKFVIQPNGVDDYWLDHIQTGKKHLNHQIIYVGRFDRNKNVVRLIHAVLKLTNRFPDIKLHLIGGDGRREKEVLTLVQKYPEYLEYHGKVYDKDALQSLYAGCSIFAMPSIHETFGLVYIEALTQNLAVVYTKDQGIDGLLDNRVGEKVDAYSIKSIQSAISKILDHRSEYLVSEAVDFEQFRWNNIARTYQQLYKNILNL